MTSTRDVDHVEPKQNPISGPATQNHRTFCCIPMSSRATIHPVQMTVSVRLDPHRVVNWPKTNEPTTANPWPQRKNLMTSGSLNPSTFLVYTAIKTMTVLMVFRLKNDAQKNRHNPRCERALRIVWMSC